MALKGENGEKYRIEVTEKIRYRGTDIGWDLRFSRRQV
jgi:hypothetical protein